MRAVAMAICVTCRRCVLCCQLLLWLHEIHVGFFLCLLISANVYRPVRGRRLQLCTLAFMVTSMNSSPSNTSGLQGSSGCDAHSWEALSDSRASKDLCCSSRCLQAGGQFGSDTPSINIRCRPSPPPAVSGSQPTDQTH